MTSDQTIPATNSRSPETKENKNEEPISNSSKLIRPSVQLGPTVACSLKRKRPPKIEIPKVLQEICSEKDNPNFNNAAVHGGDSICFSESGVGVCSVKGKKKIMEDTHKIVSSSNGKKVFFGVYDGHGGRKAAEFVAENLHENILNFFEKSPKEEAIKAAYLKTDQEFLKQGITSGVCCVTAFIEGNKIIISNLGDCRAVLSRSGVAEALTNDHRAMQEEERKMIEEKGGFVEIHRGAWRVHGILSISRSIGDSHLKQWLTAEPDTKILSLTPDMEFLVLASDGLWDKVNNQEAIDVIIRSCSVEKKPIDTTTAATITTTVAAIEEDNVIDFITTSPSPRIRRISLVKQKRKILKNSPIERNLNKNEENGFGIENENENENENESPTPPSKVRRISMAKKMKENVKPEDPSVENCGGRSGGGLPPCGGGGVEVACRELVSLAVSRGTLDDVTVMIIDLNQFKK